MSLLTARWVKPALVALGTFLGVFAIARKAQSPDCPGGGGGPYRSPRSKIPVDPYAPHETSSYDPPAKPGTKMFRTWILGLFGQRESPPSPENISRHDRVDSPSEHHEGRAWDLMTKDKAHGQKVVDYLLAPDQDGNEHALARRAGISYMIWQRQMWRAYPWQGKPSGSWLPYTGSNPHTDHVHFSFSKAGGAGQTSLYEQLRKDFPNV